MTDSHPLEALSHTIASRRSSSPEASWTARLLTSGPERIGKKIVEEAAEVALAAMRQQQDEAHTGVVQESADLIYHLLVLWEAKGISASEIWSELQRREMQSGIEEKKNRPK